MSVKKMQTMTLAVAFLGSAASTSQANKCTTPTEAVETTFRGVAEAPDSSLRVVMDAHKDGNQNPGSATLHELQGPGQNKKTYWASTAAHCVSNEKGIRLPLVIQHTESGEELFRVSAVAATTDKEVEDNRENVQIHCMGRELSENGHIFKRSEILLYPEEFVFNLKNVHNYGTDPGAFQTADVAFVNMQRCAEKIKLAKPIEFWSSSDEQKASSKITCEVTDYFKNDVPEAKNYDGYKVRHAIRHAKFGQTFDSKQEIEGHGYNASTGAAKGSYLQFQTTLKRSDKSCPAFPTDEAELQIKGTTEILRSFSKEISKQGMSGGSLRCSVDGTGKQVHAGHVRGVSGSTEDQTFRNQFVDTAAWWTRLLKREEAKKKFNVGAQGCHFKDCKHIRCLSCQAGFLKHWMQQVETPENDVPFFPEVREKVKAHLAAALKIAQQTQSVPNPSKFVNAKDQIQKMIAEMEKMQAKMQEDDSNALWKDYWKAYVIAKKAEKEVEDQEVAKRKIEVLEQIEQARRDAEAARKAEEEARKVAEEKAKKEREDAKNALKAILRRNTNREEVEKIVKEQPWNSTEKTNSMKSWKRWAEVYPAVYQEYAEDPKKALTQLRIKHGYKKAKSLTDYEIYAMVEDINNMIVLGTVTGSDEEVKAAAKAAIETKWNDRIQKKYKKTRFGGSPFEGAWEKRWNEYKKVYGQN